ncbi:MAG TPA: aminotransferase class III-fold pyridoxal phosphate-dependent enzyme, partial [Pyrinomonadaceae bacterium]|nr:aminotransferase class III-fold pyridoxal phosphate-dependent enzyme [Pyrinomonadaceae bacterium]
GGWSEAEQVQSAHYWLRHMREPVQFSAGVSTIAAAGNWIWVEVGPGGALGRLVRQTLLQGDSQKRNEVVSTLGRAGEQELPDLLRSVAQLWTYGAEVDWTRLRDWSFQEGVARTASDKQAIESRKLRRVSLPTYAFDRQRFWIQYRTRSAPNGNESVNVEQKQQEERSPAAAPVEEPVTKVDRRTSVIAGLQSIITEKSGVDAAALSAGVSFFDLGFDSLMLIQISQGIKNRFGVDVAFRLLIEDYSTIEALAACIDRLLPAGQLRANTNITATATAIRPQPGQWSYCDQPRPGISFINTPAMALQADETVRPFNTPAAPPRSPMPPMPPVRKAESTQFGPWRPVNTKSTGSLTPAQQSYLEKFIPRFTARTRKSKELTQVFRSVLADTRVSAGFSRLWKEIVYPIVGRRSAGSRIWDEDGNEYIDVTMGFGVNLFGHAPAFVTEALQEQLQDGIHIGPQSALAGEVAELICELTGAERVTFCNTGSEAVMATLRLARTVTGRSKIALFTGSYHGIDDEVLVRGRDSGGASRPVPAALGISPHKLEDVFVLPYDRPQSLAFLESRMSEFAAVLVEPVQSSRPEVQPREFLHELRRLTADQGTALIFDEMITGFRIHPGGAQTWFGVEADLATYGKVVGGGMPIGVVAGKARFMNAVDGGMWRYGDDSYPTANQTFFAGTFCKHPLAMAAARAVLTHLKANGPGLQKRLNQQTVRFAEAIVAEFTRLKAPFRINYFGSLFRFLVPRDFSYTNLFIAHLLEKGIFIGDRSGFLSTAHTDRDIETVVGKIAETVQELQDEGFLSRKPAYPQPPARPASRPRFDTSVDFRTIALTEPQKGLLALMKTGDDSMRAYNESLTMRLHGPFDAASMIDAFQKVVDRHQALRSTFSLEDNHQRIYDRLTVDVPLEDFSAFEGDERENRIATFVEEQAGRAFDLENGPVVSLRIAKLGELDHLLSITTHHIACDGLSFDFIISDLCAHYNAAQRGVPCSLPVASQISEYVNWQLQNQSSGEMDRSRRYWLDQFADGVPVVDLTTDFPRPRLQTHNGKLERLMLASALLGKLKTRAAEHGCTMFTLLLAAFMIMVHRQSQARKIVVGTPAAGQAVIGEHNLIGYCINTLPIRSEINQNGSFADYLRSIRRNVLDAYDHQHYPLYRLVRDLRLIRDPSRHPLVSISFNMDRVGAKLEFADLKTEILQNPKVFATFDLSWNVVEASNKLYVECVYNSDLFTSARSKIWMAVYELLLARVSETSDFVMRDLMMLVDETVRQDMLARENAFRSNRQGTLRNARRQVVGQQ